MKKEAAASYSAAVAAMVALCVAVLVLTRRWGYCPTMPNNPGMSMVCQTKSHPRTVMGVKVARSPKQSTSLTVISDFNAKFSAKRAKSLSESKLHVESDEGVLGAELCVDPGSDWPLSEPPGSSNRSGA